MHYRQVQDNTLLIQHQINKQFKKLSKKNTYVLLHNDNNKRW